MVIVLGLWSPASAAEPKKDAAKPPEKKPAFAGQVTGKLTRRFPTPKEMEELKKGLGDVKGDPGNLGPALGRFKEGQRHAFSLQIPGRLFPVPLEFTEDLEVRLKDPPPQFDQKGNVVRPTATVLRKLRGSDPKKPGYAGEKSNLKEGQAVTVYFLSPPVAKGPSPDKQPARPGRPDNSLQVGMIYIVEEPAAAPRNGK
jgi:hypothetical protein